jgi:hypothetical protein
MNSVLLIKPDLRPSPQAAQLSPEVFLLYKILASETSHPSIYPSTSFGSKLLIQPSLVKNIFSDKVFL